MRTLPQQIRLYQRLQWAAAAALLAVASAFYLLGYRPLNATLRALNDGIEQHRADLVRNQARTVALPRLAMRVEALRARLERSGLKLPQEPLPFIRDVTQVSQQSSLRNFAVQPMAARRAALYCEMPVCMSFESDFLSAALFLRQVEDSQRLTRMRRLTIESRDEGQGLVDVQVIMDIYFSES